MAHRNRKSGDYRCPTKADGLSEQLLGIVRALSYARTLLEVTAIVRRAVRQLTGADGATFVLREGERVHYVDEDAIGPLWKGRRFNIQACISGWSILHRKTAAIEDITTNPRIPQEAYRTTFVKSLAMVPIRSEDPVGAIGAYWARRHKPTRQELYVLQTLADAAALAFTNFQPLQGRAAVAEPEGNQDTPAAGRPCSRAT